MKKLSIHPIFVRCFSLSLLLLVGCSSTGQANSSVEFHNQEIDYQPGFTTFVSGFWNMLTSDTPDLTPDSPLPMTAMTKQQLLNEDADVIYRLGHSTMLIKLGNQWILTDPMFSERASPVQWMGPKRFHPTPITIDQLPSIDIVVISHNHFDHLDEASIVKLTPKVKHFLVPKQIAPLLEEWGVPAAKIQALNWWETTQVGATKFVFTPAQHYSGRGLGDRNETLWGGWLMLSATHKVYYSGDTGYYDVFKKIGEQYGPIDVALLEDGQYNHGWADIHMFPEQVVQASLDLKSQVMLPVHNSTFQLADHPWYEPLEKVVEIGQQKGVEVITPEFGERYQIGKPWAEEKWWSQ